MIFDGDRDRIEPYLRELADLVGLRDWRIFVSDDAPEDPEHAACVDVRYGLKVAVISFHPQWAESDPEQFRNTCCHELLHAHVNHVRWPLNNVAELVGKAIYDPLYQSVTDYIEYAVDAIATEWAKTLPLPVMAPPFPGKKTRKEVKTS